MVQNLFRHKDESYHASLRDSGTGYAVRIYVRLSVVYENSSSVTKHFYAAGLHVAENRAGIVEFFHQDHLGSTRLKTDSSGNKVFNRNYKPYGSDYGGDGTRDYWKPWDRLGH